MAARHLARVALVVALTSGSVVTTSTPAHALFHLMMVTEVFAGTSTAPDAQFVEMQMYADNQRFLTGHEVVVFDAAGEEVATFTFTGPVADGANQAYVLLATEQAETELEVDADLAMTPALARGGGSVCFRSADGGIIDCASWGSYTGDDAAAGTPFNAALGLIPGQSMARVTGGGSDPGGLDAGDDTNDSEADFDSSAPTPTNNSGGGTGPGAEPEPTVDHDRAVTLALRRSLVARGRVSADGNYAACFQGVKVRVQRKKDGAWRTLGRATTDRYGTYRLELRDRRGRYRAVAPRFSPSEGHGCLKAISPIRRNR